MKQTIIFLNFVKTCLREFGQTLTFGTQEPSITRRIRHSALFAVTQKLYARQLCLFFLIPLINIVSVFKCDFKMVTHPTPHKPLPHNTLYSEFGKKFFITILL